MGARDPLLLDADALVAIHLTDLPFRYLQCLPQDTLSDAEQRYLEAVQA